MARNKGTFKFAANFEVKAQEALDPRVVVDSKADLINKETWPYDGETIYLYNGLIVAVVADKSMYMLIDKTKVLQSDYSGWKQLDVSAAQTVEIIDNLTSQSTTAALSANQGKVLNDKITDMQSKLTAIFTYKGTKPTYAELEAVESPAVGDVYNVEEAHEGVPAGTNWVWNGTAWDALAGTVDLSGYVQKEAGKQLIPDDKLALIDTNASKIAALETRADDIESDITELQESVANVKSYFEVPTAVMSLTNASESGDILAAVGGDWSAFTTAVKTHQPIVSSITTGQNVDVMHLDSKYAQTDSANDSVTLSYLDGLNKIEIKITRATETYSVAKTTTSIAKDSELQAVKSTADSASEALVVLNGDENTPGSVKKTAKDIAQTLIDGELTWIEV